MTPLARSFRYPIFSLDFEASGLLAGTYPIEVGVARWDGPGHPTRCWSSLIAPTAHWLTDGVWIPAAEQVHNIPRTSLSKGMTPTAIMHHLNHIIGVGGVVHCDGGSYDKYWLDRLAQAANCPPVFTLSNWEKLHQALSEAEFAKALSYNLLTSIPHRAGPDAVRHIQALKIALGLIVHDDEPYEIEIETIAD